MPAGLNGTSVFTFKRSSFLYSLLSVNHFTSLQHLEVTQFSTTPSVFIVGRLFADGQSTGVS